MYACGIGCMRGKGIVKNLCLCGQNFQRKRRISAHGLKYSLKFQGLNNQTLIKPYTNMKFSHPSSLYPVPFAYAHLPHHGAKFCPQKSRVRHRVLFRSECIVLFRSFKERNVLLRSFFKFLATFETQKNAAFFSVIFLRT